MDVQIKLRRFVFSGKGCLLEEMSRGQAIAHGCNLDVASEIVDDQAFVNGSQAANAGGLRIPHRADRVGVELQNLNFASNRCHEISLPSTVVLPELRWCRSCRVRMPGRCPLLC